MSVRRGWIAVGAVAVALALLATTAAVAGRGKGKDAEDDDDKLVRFSKEQPRGTVDPERALVYVVRPTKMGYAIKSWFLCDDEVLGVNRGSSYFFAHVDPGRRVFWSKSENVDALELEVEPGKTYYIQQQVRMGGFKARTKLKVLDAAEGEKAIAKCAKHSTLTDSGRERGMTIAEEYKDRTAKDLERREAKAKSGG